MDPPYNKDFEANILPFLLESKIIKKDTLIIVEASLETDISYMENLGCEVEKVKEYKTNRHIFLRC